jgi:hypothetical protein
MPVVDSAICLQGDTAVNRRRPVTVGDLQEPLGLTHQGVIPSCADFLYPVKEESIAAGFAAPRGFDLDGISYIPSTMHFKNSKNQAFFAFESHKAVQLHGLVVCQPDGQYRSCTVLDLLMLIKTATLEFITPTSSQLVITRLAETGETSQSKTYAPWAVLHVAAELRALCQALGSCNAE